MTIVQLNPPLPLNTPKGSALAHFLIDYGPEHDLMWTVFLDANGECWTFPNQKIRATRNETMGRNSISPITRRGLPALPPSHLNGAKHD